jgi:hypothetical protein
VVRPTATHIIIATAMEAIIIPTLTGVRTTTTVQEVPAIALAADRQDRLPKEEAVERVSEKWIR